MHKLLQHCVSYCFLVIAILIAMAMQPSTTAIAQAPFLIPDNTNATCVIFDFVAKKHIGVTVDTKVTLRDDSFAHWPGGAFAVCDATGSWILTWSKDAAQLRGCVTYGGHPPDHDFSGVGNGYVYSAASSVKCRDDGRWELVKGWR